MPKAFQNWTSIPPGFFSADAHACLFFIIYCLTFKSIVTKVLVKREAMGSLKVTTNKEIWPYIDQDLKSIKIWPNQIQKHGYATKTNLALA